MIKDTKELGDKFENLVEQYQAELKKMKAGRASAELVEGVQVDNFGAKTPLIHMATINILDAKTIEISPWNKDQIKEIQKAVSQSDLGLNPSEDGEAIRIIIPPMTEERRAEMVKQVKKKTEETRIKMRQFREEFWKMIQDQEKQGEISEDDKFKNKDDLQGLMDEYNKKIDDIEFRKEEDLMQV